jgi:arabinoxylan arabinofuranohydrolase
MLLRFLLLFMVTCISATAADGGYLFVTFRGEATPMSEQIYFALSQDGKNWEALNNGDPVLVSTLGDKGVRDPFLLRSHDGKKFYILATDLSMNLHGDWTRATHSASKSLIIWESNDLTHWSDPRIVQVAPDDAGCAWAPEAVYDEETKDYLVFWASMTKSDNFAKQRIWAARTTDFVTFGKPFIYIEKPWQVIDTDIVQDNGKYYRFSKDEQFKAITMEVSDKLMGPWQDVPNFSLAKMTGYEGPECYLLNPASGSNPATWCLILDQYSRGAGYQPFVTQDLAGAQFTKADDFKFPFLFRHGSVLPVSELEYQQLKAAYTK